MGSSYPVQLPRITLTLVIVFHQFPGFQGADFVRLPGVNGAPNLQSPAVEEKSSNSCSCDYTHIFTRLPSFLKSIAEDKRTEFAFMGPPGPPGFTGLAGPQGIQGRPGEKGERGLMGPPGVSVSGLIGEKGDLGYHGPEGRQGRKGQKGEPTRAVYYRRILEETVVEVKGEKGADGRRGRKGDPGQKGPPGLSIQGEKGEKGEPPFIDYEAIKGPPGERGPPGFPGPRAYCKPCLSSKDPEKIYIPVERPGPPGLTIVGPPGPPGKAIESGLEILRVQRESQLLESRFLHSSKPGRLAYLTTEETLYVRTQVGWKQVQLGRLISPDQQQPERITNHIEDNFIFERMGQPARRSFDENHVRKHLEWITGKRM